MLSIKRLYIVCLSLFIVLGSTSKESEKSVDLSIDRTALNEVQKNLVNERGYIVKVGDMAPDFDMTLVNGERISLSSLKGKVVMLQFTASWCGVCRKEMPHIEKDIWAIHKNNSDFALFGIDREEPVEKVNELIEKTGVTYPIGLDFDAGIFTLYAEKAAGITRNVIIDRDGRIVMLTRLFDMDEFKDMVQVINSLLDNTTN